MDAIAVSALSRNFGNFVAVDPLTFSVTPGEVSTLQIPPAVPPVSWLL